MNPTRRSFLHALGLAPLAAWLTSRVSAAPALPAPVEPAVEPPLTLDTPDWVGSGWNPITGHGVEMRPWSTARDAKDFDGVTLFAESHPHGPAYRVYGHVCAATFDPYRPWDDACEYEIGRPLYVGTDGSAVPEGHELRDPAPPRPVGTVVDFTTSNTAWVRLGPGEDVRRGDLLVREGATVRKAKTCAHGKRTGEWCTGCVDWAHT